MFPDPQVVDDVIGFRCWSGVPAVMAVAHRHDDIEVNVVVGGELVYLFGGRTVRIAAGQIGAFWAVMPHQVVQVADGTVSHWLTIPISMFLTWSFPDAARSSLLAVRPLIGPTDADEDVEGAAFARWTSDLASGSEERRGVAALEMQARLRRLALAGQRPVGEEHEYERAGSTPAMAHAAGMAQFVAQRYADPIGPVDVAAAAHLHPHYAMTVFRRVVGTTLGRYLSECRVAHAQRLLLGSDLPVTEVGIRSGFTSSSRFFATFSEVCGTSPGAYRKQSMAERPGSA
jgi:AraC-like DNA-binding protein